MKEYISCRTILLIAPPVLKPGIWVSDKKAIVESGRLAEVYRSIAEKEQTAFADASEWEIEVLSDGVHFSPSGHAVFAEKLAGKLDAITGVGK